MHILSALDGGEYMCIVPERIREKSHRVMSVF